MIGSRFFRKLGLIIHPVDWDYGMRHRPLNNDPYEAISYKIKIGDELATIRSKWLSLVTEEKDDI